MPPLQKRMLNLTKPQHLWLQEEAERRGITVSELLRRIVDQYRDAHPSPTTPSKEA